MRNLPILLFGLVLPSLADDQSDFSSTPDAAWVRYSPLSPSYPASLDFSQGQCQITCPQPSLEIAQVYGGARGGLFAPSIMTDSVASVDIVGWAPSESRALSGIHMFALTRVQDPIGLGSVNGYAALVIDMGANSGPGGVGRNGRLQLFFLQNEAGSSLTFDTYVDFLFDPVKDYRLLLISRGIHHTARIFDLANPATPVAELYEQDSTYPSGRTGFIIYNDRLAPLDVTFDNFLAWDGTPPPLVIQPGSDPATVALSSDLHRSMASDLQSTTDFTDPLAPWLPATPASASVNGNQLVTVFPIDGPRRFFRRKSL